MMIEITQTLRIVPKRISKTNSGQHVLANPSCVDRERRMRSTAGRWWCRKYWRVLIVLLLWGIIVIVVSPNCVPL